jgi:hypothetical protein
MRQEKRLIPFKISENYEKMLTLFKNTLKFLFIMDFTILPLEPAK